MFAVRPICVQDSIFKMSSESPEHPHDLLSGGDGVPGPVNKSLGYRCHNSLPTVMNSLILVQRDFIWLASRGPHFINAN